MNLKKRDISVGRLVSFIFRACKNHDFSIFPFTDEGYSQIVLKSLNGSDLFNLHSLLSMCRIERELIQAKHYKELCIRTVEKPKKCCRPWSLANYIALLHKRKSCLALTVNSVGAWWLFFFFFSK